MTGRLVLASLRRRLHQMHTCPFCIIVLKANTGGEVRHANRDTSIGRVVSVDDQIQPFIKVGAGPETQQAMTALTEPPDPLQIAPDRQAPHQATFTMRSWRCLDRRCSTRQQASLLLQEFGRLLSFLTCRFRRSGSSPWIAVVKHGRCTMRVFP